MKLKKFLSYFDFDYRIEDGEIALVDCADANLGDIESERFPIDNLTSLIDRLDTYYKDYIFDGLAEKYGIDPDDWPLIYKTAMEDGVDIDVLPVIMGDEPLEVEKAIIVHDIVWDCDDENKSSLPKYMVVPSDLVDDEIGDYISNQTGYCHHGFAIGLRFIDCLELIEDCVKAEILVEKYGLVCTYRKGGHEGDGWYWNRTDYLAQELLGDEEGQAELIEALNKKIKGE